VGRAPPLDPCGIAGGNEQGTAKETPLGAGISGGARSRRVRRRRQTEGADGAGRLAARVCQRRVLRGLTQEELAAHLVVTHRQIQRYERGLKRVGAARLHARAKTVACPSSTCTRAGRSRRQAADRVARTVDGTCKSVDEFQAFNEGGGSTPIAR
jgi:hypothetical protein